MQAGEDCRLTVGRITFNNDAVLMARLEGMARREEARGTLVNAVRRYLKKASIEERKRFVIDCQMEGDDETGG